MPDATELSAAPDEALCVFGKHPAHGDFLSHGVDRTIEERLMRWLDATLSCLRERLGPDWPVFWDDASALRFWIGQSVVGRTVAGVLFPSRDAVGRRYPLIVAVTGRPVPPPVIEPDQTLWQILAGLPDAGDARGWMVGSGPALSACGALATAEETALAELWARRGDGDSAALLRDAERMDHAHAALTRSYWWRDGAVPGDAAAWLGCQGLPEADALAWCLQSDAEATGAAAGQGTSAAPGPETSGRVR